MTRRDDYLSDMPHVAITEAEAEIILSSGDSPDQRLDELTHVLNTIDLSRLEIDLEDKVGRFALRAAALARHRDQPGRPGLLARLTPRIAGVTLAALFLVSTTGLGLAADASAPGDLLYGLDRAVEQIGLNDGGIQERLAEAEVLADRGQSSDALEHIADSLPEDAGPAADALQRAAERLDSNENTEDVGSMLDWMASTDTEGREFGQGVAERARELGQGPDKPKPDSRGQGNNNGNGPPGGSPPGQADK